jgi:serine/threonine-protein phosphatase 2A regulatory subunit A
MSVVHDTDLFHIAQLVDQLRHDDVHHRINAVKSLSSIASALGPDRTRDELLPFLTESTDDEHDVLVIIAEKLGDLVRYVGGKEYVYLILQTLEILLMNDQVHVREAAILSTETCADFMTPEHFKHYYIPFVIRLAYI